MKVMSKKTRRSSEEVLQRAKDFFNNNLGLKLSDESSNCCVEFKSNLGFVTVTTTDDNIEREVTVSTREYEAQIQEFLKRI
jgi:hypothetical protein